MGTRLAEARKIRRLTQKQLAEKLKIDAITLSRYERDDQPMSLERVRQVAVALELDEPWLLYGIGSAPVAHNSGSNPMPGAA